MHTKNYVLPRTKEVQIEAAKRIADHLSNNVAPKLCSFMKFDCFIDAKDKTPSYIFVGTISASLQDFAACAELANSKIMKSLGPFRYTIMYPVYLLLLALGIEKSCEVVATVEFDDDGVQHQCKALSGISCLKISDMGKWNYEKLFPLCTYQSKCCGITVLKRRLPSIQSLKFLSSLVDGVVSVPFYDEKLGIDVRYITSMELRAQDPLMISTDGQNPYKQAVRIRLNVVEQGLALYY